MIETTVTGGQLIGIVGTAALTMLGASGAFLKFIVMDHIADLKADVKDLKTNVSSLVVKLEDCNEHHTAALERAARAEAALKIVGEELRPSVQEKVARALGTEPQGGR